MDAIEEEVTSNSPSVNNFQDNNEDETNSANLSSSNVYYNSTMIEIGDEVFWIPRVNNDVLPVLGTVFADLNQCINMYERYANAAGFDKRLATQKKTKNGLINVKYVKCNKADKEPYISMYTISSNIYGRNDQSETSNNKRQKVRRTSSVQRTKCGAFVVFKLISGQYSKYVLADFQDKHNHQLNAKAHNYLSKSNRKLGIPEMSMIHSLSTSNIGATKAHQIYSNAQGSHKNTHGTVSDFKNHKKRINCIIGSNDSQMIVNKMLNRKDCNPEFSFEYSVKGSELTGMFWADEIAKVNYKEFGDIISFDATYKTNRYNMVFVPFTAIDNHKKLVLIGVGMLVNETADSYIWLLKSFLKAFGCQPKMVVTDQDVSMKKAVKDVFPESRHRLCMWHITLLIPIKLQGLQIDEADFKKKFNNIIWSISISTSTFESRWKDIMKEFEMEDHTWFTEMYRIRDTWIPAFFNDLPMSVLMRTTSRSESENSFFDLFMNSGAMLVQFMMCYETAIERQGGRLDFLDHLSHIKRASYLTPMDIEQHASKIYTRTIFLLVQKEISLGIYKCSQNNVVEGEDGNEVYTIKEAREFKKTTEKVVKKKSKEKYQVEDDQGIVTVDPYNTVEETENALRVASEADTVKKVYNCDIRHQNQLVNFDF